jgi:hypothetical protein
MIEKSTQLSSQEREELLSQIDFSRVNEETISACKTNKLIPQQLIADAALALCAKLRSQLEETQARLRLAENELVKPRPTYTSSSMIYKLLIILFTSIHSLGYRTRHYESPRIPTRSRLTKYINNYDLPTTTSTYSYPKYDSDSDFDNILPSRYISSSLSSRYGAYSTYRY